MSRRSSTSAQTAEPISPKAIQGLKYFDMLIPLLEPLHDEQCMRDKANDRELHFDQYCMIILLYIFNPIVTSLRAITQVSELCEQYWDGVAFFFSPELVSSESLLKNCLEVQSQKTHRHKSPGS